MVDVVLPAAAGLFGDDVLRLTLGADEQHLAALGRLTLEELERLVPPFLRLLQIDDVDAVALAEDERSHLRIPASGLMAEMNTGLEQFSQRYADHVSILPSAC